MKTRKKLVSILCAVALLVSALPAASAMKITEANNINADFYTQVENFLLNAGAEYDISKYDNVFLGGEIPAYYVEDEAGTLQTSSIHYYPILTEDSVIGLLQAYNDKNGNQVFYYSEAYCDTINGFLKENASIAVVGDGSTFSVMSSNKIENLTSTESTEDLPSEYNNVSFSSPYNALHPLNITTHQQPRAENSHMIEVPKKEQHAYWACWAACVASFGQYCEWTPIYTSKQVADEYGWHSYATMAQTKAALKQLYNISPSLYYESPRVNKLTQYISNNKPLAAGFWKVEETDNESTDNVGHMVIIRGYASNSSFFNISIMDPNTGDYALVNVPSTSPITIPLGIQLWELQAYLVNA